MDKILISMLRLAFSCLVLSILFSGNDIEAVSKVMVFAPHPDDDIIGCGGSLIMHKKKGAEIVIVYMTSGDQGSHGGNPHELAQIREVEAQKAAAIIGVENLIFLREPDGKLVHSRENTRKIADIISNVNPEIIYVPHRRDGHKDHKTTFWIVKAALEDIRRKSGAKMPTVYCYEVWTPLKQVKHRVDIKSVMSTKLDALAEHKTQGFIVKMVKSGKTMSCGNTFECFEKLVI